MISAQASREQRLELGEKISTDVIENNSDILSLEQKVKDLAQQLLDL